MRDPKRIDEILDVVKELWKLYPDQRFGQLVVNALPSNNIADIFYVEDDKSLIALKRFLNTHRKNNNSYDEHNMQGLENTLQVPPSDYNE